MAEQKILKRSNQQKENPLRHAVYFSSHLLHELKYNNETLSKDASWGFGGAGPSKTSTLILEHAVASITDELKGISSMFLQKVIMASDQNEDLWLDKDDILKWIADYRTSVSPDVVIPSAVSESKEVQDIDVLTRSTRPL